MGVFNHDVDGDDIVDDFFNDVLVDVTTDNNDKINNDIDNNVSGRKGLLMQNLYSFFFCIFITAWKRYCPMSMALQKCRPPFCHFPDRVWITLDPEPPFSENLPK